MTEIDRKEELLAGWLRDIFCKIGLPVGVDHDAHIIKPSSIQIVSDHMSEVIHRLGVDHVLKKKLLESYARELINPVWLYDERGAVRIDFRLPETIGDLKICLARGAGVMADDGWNYKWDLPLDDPARAMKARTSNYMPTVYAEIFKALNRVLVCEGFPTLQRAGFRRARSLTARTRPGCG